MKGINFSSTLKVYVNEEFKGNILLSNIEHYLTTFIFTINESVLNFVGPYYANHLPNLSHSTYLPITYIAIFSLLAIMYICTGGSGKRWRVESSKSALKRIKGIKVPAQVIAYLRKMDHFTFEELILTSINRNTFVDIKRNDRYTGDGGVDGKFYINGNLFLIQAKRYSGFVKTSDIEDLLQKVRQYNAAGALFVHTGKTSNAALKRYSDGKVFVVSGHAMVTLVQKGKLPLGLLSLAQLKEL